MLSSILTRRLAAGNSSSMISTCMLGFDKGDGYGKTVFVIGYLYFFVAEQPVAIADVVQADTGRFADLSFYLQVVLQYQASVLGIYINAQRLVG